MTTFTRRFRRLVLTSISLFFLCGFLGVSARAMNLLGTAWAQEKEEGQSESRELIYKIVNFTLLAVILGYALRKPLAGFFADRSASIRKGLEDGRKALEASRGQLQIIEEKLQHLEEEIAAFKAAAAKEMAAERDRLRQAASEESERILQAARAQIETATRAARLELQAYTVQQALRLAEDTIRERMDQSSRERLFSRFLAGLEGGRSRN